MKTLAFIQARMGSTRLPGKIMLPLSGKPLLDHLVENLRFCEEIDEIIILTTDTSKDDAVEKYCIQKGIRFFRGSESNLLDRFHKAGKHFRLSKWDLIVRITSDDIWIDKDLLSSMITLYKAVHPTVRFLTNAANEGFPYGMYYEMFDFDTLEKTAAAATEDYDKEHVTTYMKRPGFLPVLEIKPVGFDLSDVRLSIDTEDDLKKNEAILSGLQSKFRRPYSIANIIEVYKELTVA